MVEPALMATTRGKLIAPLLELDELEELELLEDELLDELDDELEDELLVRPELELLDEELLDDELLEEELEELLEELGSTGPLQALASTEKRMGTPQRVSS